MDDADLISSFIPEYPDVDDENLIYDITKKKEFYDLRLGRDEPTPEKAGDLLQSQIFMKRFFSPETPNNKALLFQGMGSGKCLLPGNYVYTEKGVIEIKKLSEDYGFSHFPTGNENDPEGEWFSAWETIKVWSYDENKKKMILSPVTNFFRQLIDEDVVEVQLENYSVISMTRAHKLYDGKNWTNQYKVGDYVYSFACGRVGLSKIASIKTKRYSGYVYDLEVDVVHNYVANNFLCHNSCTASAIVENFKSTEYSGRKRRPALVFVKSSGLAADLRQKIAEVCTRGIYTAKPTLSELKKGVQLTKLTKIKRIVNAIRTSYQIVTYETFLKSLPSAENIKKMYSGRVIILDESHTLRIQPKRKRKEGILEVIQEVADEKEAKEVVMLYNQMYDFLHTVEDCRILLLTGTPIWDQTYEFASQMNLILDERDKLPVGQEFDSKFFDKEGNLINANELKEKIRGRISFLRPMTTTAKRMEMGATGPWLKYVKVFPDVMSQFQSAYTQKAREDVETKTIKLKGKVVKREVKGGTVLKLARNAANMVIPIFDERGEVVDGGYDQETFRKYAIKQKRSDKKSLVSTESYGIENAFLRRQIKENLQEYSSKFASIIQNIKDHPDEIVFVHNEFVTGPGGAIMFALCLQIHGFFWAKSAADIHRPSATKRFVIFTSKAETTSLDTQILEILESAGRDDNKYAERLQVIIGSSKISEGWTIKNNRQVHITSPHWNIPSIEQALARGIRFGSHESLPPVERYIKIFRHVSVDPGTLGGVEVFPPGATFSQDQTVDTYIYGIAEEKEHKNTEIYRLIKEISFDCALNYKRNVLPEDEDGSRSCDYKKCNYECEGFEPDKKEGVWDYSIPPEEIDRSTYDLFYSEEEVREMAQRVVGLFRNYFALHIELVVKLLGVEETERVILLKAIEHLVNGRILLKSRFGFGCYIKEKGNMLFLDNNISPFASYPESTYISNPLVTEKNSFNDLLEIMELRKDKGLMKKLCNDPEEEDYNQLSYRSKVLLLEMVYLVSLREKLNKKEKRVVDFFEEDLENSIYKLDEDTIVHAMYMEEYKGSSYDVVSKELKPSGLLRRLDVDRKMWKFVDDEEEEMKYLERIRGAIEGKRSMCENEYGICGWVSRKDKIFRISIQGKGKRGVKGLNCASFNVNELIDIFMEKIHFLPKSFEIYNDLTQEGLLHMIGGSSGGYLEKYHSYLKDKDAGYLARFLTLITMGKERLCSELKNWLQEKGFVYEF